MVGKNRTELTYFYERWRAVAAGILESAGSTFLLLIAVRWFKAGSMAKALVASGGSVGLLLAPWVVSWVGALGWTASRAASRLALLGAGCFALMALAPVVAVYVAGSMLAMAATASAVPLMTQIYQENYPEHSRGRLFSRTVMIRIGIAAVFSELAGRALTGHLEQFRLLLLLFAGTFLGSSWCLARCPSRPLTVSGRAGTWRNWQCIREDRLFRYTLICWMLMGFANLMMFPMRVEYLANPKYGWALNIGLIATFTSVIPNLARLCVSPLWGWLFDRLDFFALRVIVNIGFGLGILAFFLSHDLAGLVAGSLVIGVSNAGGDVAWGLWVTKFASPERVADYMAVHTFFTGVRGILAPVTAFHLVNSLPMSALGWISAGLIVLASLLLLPEIHFGQPIRRTAPLVEEVSE